MQMITDDLTHLIQTLSLQKIDDRTYEGHNVPFTRHHIFGGQILAQALHAAMNEIAPDRLVHSYHAYFLKMGNRQEKVRFLVDYIRDGRSFATRRVSAYQNDNVIFEAIISFQKKERGLVFQTPMPNVAAPHELEDEVERWNNHPIVQTMPEKLITFKPVEIRHSSPMDWFDVQAKPAQSGIWIKTRGALPDDQALHKIILSYFSDTMLYGAALRPHGLTFHFPKLHGASLDHAIWFHDDLRADQWLFYQQDGIWSGCSRGLNHGKFYTQDGRHVASTTQEGLMRLKD